MPNNLRAIAERMEMAGHTPGPWSWDAGIIPPDGPGRYADIYVTGEDREPIVLAEFNDSLPEGRANATLMVAAPDMLAALYQYRSDMRHPPAPDSRERRIEMIDALIAKATAASLRARDEGDV
jgi:hypothetical protein